MQDLQYFVAVFEQRSLNKQRKEVWFLSQVHGQEYC